MTALITGATSGIGAEYARRLSSDGYDLIITGRRTEKLHLLADELSRVNGNQIEVHIVELSDPAQVEEFIRKIRDRHIHLLINNAGFGTTKLFHQESIEVQEKMVSVHILAHMRLIHAILPEMLKKRSGAIINMSSSGTFLPSPKTATYNGTKAFLEAFTESLHMELEGTGVQVQVVCPGLTRTDIHLRAGIPEEATSDWGPFKWISPYEVVKCSLRCLKKKRVVCIPGRMNRIQVFVRHLTPASLYYRMSSYFFRRYGWTDRDV